MTLSVHFVLQLFALLCLFCAAIGAPSSRISLGWLGMFLWLLDITIR